MKDYWRLIGINEDASEDQIRQAHFRAFRYFQGKKNESKKAAERAVAELVIEYLRNAQYNPDLPIPSSVKHVLKEVPVNKYEAPKPPVEPPIPPTERIAPIHAERRPPSNAPQHLAEAQRSKIPQASPVPSSNRPPMASPVPPTTLSVPPTVVSDAKANSLNNQANSQVIPPTVKFAPVIPPTEVFAPIKVAQPSTKEPVQSTQTMTSIPASTRDLPPTDRLKPAGIGSGQSTNIIEAQTRKESLKEIMKEVAKETPPTPAKVPQPAAPTAPAKSAPSPSGPLTQIMSPMQVNQVQQEQQGQSVQPGQPVKKVETKLSVNRLEQAVNKPDQGEQTAEQPAISRKTDPITAGTQALGSLPPELTKAVQSDEDDIMLEPDFENDFSGPVAAQATIDRGLNVANLDENNLSGAVEVQATIDRGLNLSNLDVKREFNGSDVKKDLDLKQEKNSSGRQVIIGDVISCPDCEWDILSQTDSYCTGCGKSITSVAVPSELIVYTGESGSFAKNFTITNDGLIPITINSFEVIDIDASVYPRTTVVLGKNEAMTAQLRISEANPFGKRSGKLRFLYHDKPREISILLKEPPRIWLAFPDVPVAHPIENGFLLRVPVNQQQVSCKVATDSELPINLSGVSLGNEVMLDNVVQIRRDQPFLFEIKARRDTELSLTLVFQELGSRRSRIIIDRVEAPNLIDNLERFNIGENALIINSGVQENRLIIKNIYDPISGRGRGSAQKIKLSGLPEWLKVEPPVIPELLSGEAGFFRLLIDTNKLTAPCRAYAELYLEYFDQQLECLQRRNEKVQLSVEFIQPRDFDDWIAIDFGTSNSCAAILEGATIKGLIIDADANHNPQESPTCIQFVDATQKIYECGLSAYSKRFSGPRAIKATAWAFKPLLSRSTEAQSHTYLDIMQGRAHTKTVDELIEIYVRSLIEAVKLRNGIAPRKAVVTFPVTFGQRQRQRLANAFRAAGLEEVITPVSEPVALAIHYAYQHREIFLNTSVFGIFDFGGGTTDLAIFQIRPPQQTTEQPQLQLLDVSGVELGGELLTFELARFIYELLVPLAQRNRYQFPHSLDELIAGNSDVARENYRHLAIFAEYLKKSFADNPQIFQQEINQNLICENGNETFRGQLKREAVENILRPRIKELIDALIAMVTALHDRKKIGARKLDFLILGGNSSRLKLVTEMIADALFEGDRSRVLLDTDNIKTGVTKGALLYAVAPEALPFPVEQVNHTLPCRVGLVTTGFRFDTLFERGLIAIGEEAIARRQLYLPQNRDYIRLYYYFGHENDPKVLGNTKMREYAIPCTEVAGREVAVQFRLLPECEGIEVVIKDGDKEVRHVAPILGSV